MSERCETFRVCKTTILLSSVNILILYTIPCTCGFYGSSKEQNEMYELSVFSQIQSQLMLVKEKCTGLKC